MTNLSQNVGMMVIQISQLQDRITQLEAEIAKRDETLKNAEASRQEKEAA